MNKAKISQYILITALVSGAIGILGEYDWVVIKGVSKYSFELLLVGFGLLVLSKLFKK
ncbi:MAG: hypothetical protein PF517_19695 [Salinivirgaceae bacterium]|jgi:hypothetical protein|nr:hypothetical protein [Salinivirgaceae bacterium]